MKDIFSYLLLTLVLSGCSAMGKVAKSTFYTASESWKLQPQAVRDAYPMWMKKTFYTSELLLTPIQEWRLKLVSDVDISQELIEGTVQLSYELDEEKYSLVVPLVIEKKIIPTNDTSEFSYIFVMNSPEAKAFWQQYNEHLFKFDKPWFDYFLQPKFSSDSKLLSKIKRIEYKYVASFDFLTLAEFMRHFDFLDDDKWHDFCTNKAFIYPRESACGLVTITDTE